MKKFISFLVLILFFSCSNNKNDITVDIKLVDTSRVHYSVTKDTLFLEDTPSLESEITCPKCKFKKKEMMPTDNCLLKYTCTNCGEVLYPDEKDCCVFCTYGTYKCPSKQ